MAEELRHEVLAERLRARVESAGVTPLAVRRGALAIGSGRDATLDPPFDELARTVAYASDHVTDDMVQAVVDAAGSQKAAFEVVTAASVGAGLQRWGAAIRAIEEATDAPE